MYGLVCESRHCPDGCELEGGVFRYRSRRRFPIKLETFDLQDPFVLRFVSALDDNELVQFFSQFGFLDPYIDEIPRKDVLNIQRHLRKLTHMAGSDQAKEAAQAFNKMMAHTGAEPSVEPSMDGRRLALKVGSLYGLMRMELGMITEKDARLMQCEHCTMPFLVGATTGRRTHARYCSDRCRVAAMRVRKAS
jgi:hypothetical protein